jgi:acetyl-CoA carboxylase biotin carboxyl carrier protein
VQIGDVVTPDTVVGIIEVMKLMNSVKAGHHGRVARILVGDGDLVEQDQPLFVLEAVQP